MVGTNQHDSLTDAVPSYTLPARLQQAVVETPCKLRLVTLAALLARCAAQAPARAKAVVFFSACDCVEFAHRLLEGAMGNLPGCGTLFKLHGLMTQVCWCWVLDVGLIIVYQTKCRMLSCVCADPHVMLLIPIHL